MCRPGDTRGFTLIEVLMVLAIVAVSVGAVTVSFRSLRRTTAKAGATRLAAAIRYTYDRAVTTGAYYRLVLDLTNHTYWVEKSDERFYLVRERESSPGRGRAPGEDEEEAERRRDEEEKEAKESLGSGSNSLLAEPPRSKRARFEAFKDSNLPRVELKDVRVRDIYTRRQSEPYTEGKAFLYFFPDGHTERAVIHVDDPDGDVYTLLVQPLTGRVEVKSGDSGAPRDFDLDAEGRSEAPR